MQVNSLNSNSSWSYLDVPVDKRVSDIQKAIENVQQLLREHYSSERAEQLIAQLDGSPLNSCQSHAAINSFLFEGEKDDPSFLSIFQKLLYQLQHVEEIPNSYIPSGLAMEITRLKKTIFDRYAYARL